MPTATVIGAQWGDEGKGRVIDLLAADADIVVRSNGGSNAGHSVENDLGRFALALTPSGIFNPAAICILGGGMVVNPRILLDEMDALSARGVPLGNLRLSARAALVMPWHQWLDGKRETAAGANMIGTTKQGIGPAYAEKAMRTIMRAIDLRDADRFVEKVSAAHASQPQEFRDGEGLPELLKAARTWAERLGPLVKETDGLVRDRWKAGDDILLEGAQGSLLDLDIGTYPFCTSSDCTALGALKGAGLPPQAANRVIGVMKAYVTRVGSGPFPTVLNDETGEFLRRVGHEFGTRTGRKRDCGWFDGPLARYSVDHGLTEITLTKLDVMTGLETVKLAVGYVLDGVRSEVATNEHVARLSEVSVDYETFPGWKEDIAGVRKWEDLPANARSFVRRIEEAAGVPVTAISTSPRRDDIIAVPGYRSFTLKPASVCGP